jgi:hypothetical protein
MPNLVQEIKTLLKKGDTITGQAEKFYKAAGEKLIELRGEKIKGKVRTKKEFEQVVRQQCGIGKSWAYVLMRIAEGKTTLKKEQAANTKAKKKQRAGKSPGRPGQDDDDDELVGDTPEQRWHNSLGNMAGEGVSLRAYWSRIFGEDWKTFKVPSDLVTLARQCADEWTEIADEVTTRAGAIPMRQEKQHG